MRTNHYDDSTWSKQYKYYACWVKAFKECLGYEYKMWLSTTQMLEFNLRSYFDKGFTPSEAAEQYNYSPK
jgi:hypothetical protein